MQPHRLLLLGSLLLLVPWTSAQTTLFEVRGPASHSFGRVCDLLGDVDGDGLGDLCIGVYGKNVPGIGPNAGAVDIVAGPSGLTLRTFLGPSARAYMGSFTTSLGAQESLTALLGQTYVLQLASLFPAGPCGQRLATRRGLPVTFQ